MRLQGDGALGCFEFEQDCQIPFVRAVILRDGRMVISVSCRPPPGGSRSGGYFPLGYEMSPELSKQTGAPVDQTWDALWKEMAIRPDGSIRAVPDLVESDIVVLRDAPSSEVSADARETSSRIRDRLDTYRRDVEFLESRGLTEDPRDSRVKEALYSYLRSDRSWGDFRIFERSVASWEHLPLVDRVFARDAGVFIEEIGARWDKNGRVAEFRKFIHLAERSIAAWDISAAQGLWSTVFEGVRRGVIEEKSALLLAKLIAERGDITELSLRRLLESLADRPLADTPENGQGLTLLGKILSARVGESTELSSNQLRSDPRVELGYLASRIHQLSILAATRNNQRALVDLFKRAAERAEPATLVPRPNSWRDDSLATIRGHALQSMYVRSENYAREILDASMPLLRESWSGNTSVIFRELIGMGSNAPKGIALYAFREVISSDCVLHALYEQCAIRGRASYFREDRRRLVALLRDTINTERALDQARAPIVLSRAIALLGQLSEEARVAVPDVLALLGIRARSLGRLGFVASPWSMPKETDADVRAAAQNFARVWEGQFSRGIRRRLQQDLGAEAKRSD